MNPDAFRNAMRAARGAAPDHPEMQHDSEPDALICKHCDAVAERLHAGLCEKCSEDENCRQCGLSALKQLETVLYTGGLVMQPGAAPANESQQRIQARLDDLRELIANGEVV